MNNKRKLLIVLLVVAVSSLGIGFAAFSTRLNIIPNAFVNPNENDFSVVLTTRRNTLKTTDIIVEKSDNSIVTEDVVINNSRYPTISNIAANLSSPGQSVAFKFYVYNNGEYDAYLTNINYKKLSNDGTKLCSPLTGTSAEQASSACEAINFSMTIDGDEYNETTGLSNHKLVKGTSEEIILTVEYDENGPTTPGGFSVDFSDIELIFGSVDSSYSIDPNTGEIITKQYTLTYDTDGGTIENNETTKVITYNTKIGELKSPSRTGYTFGGWYTDKTYTTLVTEETIYNLKSDMTIYAKWTPNVYSVVFNPLPGELGQNDITGKDVTYDSTYGDLPEPTLTGYVFVGWYLETTFVNKIESNTKVEITSINTPLYAKYVENNFTITLDPNGGTLNNTTKNIKYGDEYGNIEEPTREGYTFTGWYRQDNSLVSPDDKYQLITNETLHAEWTANSYTITLDANGGTVSPSTKTVTYDSAFGALPDATRTGYEFKGWYTDNTYTTQVTAETIVKVTSDNESIIAKWEANQHHVNYYSEGQLVRTDDIDYEASYSSFPTVSKQGYTLTGWFTAETGGTQVQTTDIFRETSDQNLYAHWEANTNTRYYVKHWKQKVDGDASLHNSTNYTLEETDTLYGTTDTTVTPDRKTYTGFTAPSGETVTIAANGNSTLNYYYTRNTYTVSFDININDDDEYTLSENTITVTYGSTYANLPTATRTGYTLYGWYTNTDYATQITNSTTVDITSDQVLYARWSANTNTNYTVKHWQQKINGDAATHNSTNYDLVETTPGQGTTGQNVTPAVNSYTGFTAPSTQTKKIKSDGSMVINYYYTRNQYTLTINKGTGISTVTGAGTHYFGESITVGYTLSTGYSFSSITGDKTTTTFTMPASNTTVTVNGVANTYSITYNLDGGSLTGTNPASGTYNSVVTLKSPTKTGYRFTGWTVTTGLENPSNGKYGSSSDSVTSSITNNTTLAIGSSATANTYVKNLTSVANGSVTLKANWTAQVYNLSLYLYDNQYYENSSYTITYNSNYPALPEPTRTGYTFAGWYKNTNFQEQDKITTSTVVTETEDTTIYAKWIPNTYEVVYHSNGGTGTMSNQQMTYGETTTLTTNAFERAGYTFGGWTTNSDGTGTTYSNGQSVSNLTTSSTFDLYAKWITNQYTVTLNKNADEAALTTTSINITYGGKYTGLGTAQTTPSRTGYTFLGWFTSTGTQVTNNSTVQIVGDHTLYAHWQAISYQVTFNANGGTVDTASKYVTYDNTYGEYNSSTQVYDSPLPEPTRAGYTFLGWFTSASGGTEKTNSTVVKITDAETLYAHWQANTNTAYTVNHWQQKVGGNANFHNSSNFTLIETDNLTGTTDTTVTPDRKTYTGFTSPSGQEITILGNGSVTVDYYYARESYSVTFNSKGGNAVNTVLNVTYGYSYGTMPSLPTKTGYTFGGWYLDDESYETQITNNSRVTTASNHVLYAKWTPSKYNKYTVYHWKQKLDGDASQHDDTNYTLATTQSLNGTTDASVTPVRNEYDGFTAPSGETVTIAADGSTVVNYYYTRNSYTLTVNSGTGISTTTGAGSYLYGALVTIGYTVSPGYTYSGITGDKTTARFTMPASNTTVTVNAKANTYTIYFDGNGNTSGSVRNEQMTYDEAKNLPKNTYTKTGYTFAGWSQNSDGSGTQYTDEQSVINLATSGSVKIYAKWTPNTYNITFDKNHEDATGTMENEEVTYYTNVTLTTNAYTRPGYTFDGWATTSSGSKKYDDGATFKWTKTNDLTLYARWKAKNIVITYDPNGGSVSSSTKNVAYGNTYGSLQTATRTGYTFGGWYLETDTTFQNEITSSTTVTIATAHTLKAKWTPITYTYKLRTQNLTTSWADLPDNTATYDTVVTLTAPTKSGYTFAGWTIPMNKNETITRWGTSSSDVNNTYSSDVKMIGESPTDPVYVKNLRTSSSGYVGLEASWTGNTYTVTLNPNGGKLSKTETEVTYGRAYTGLETPSKTGYAFDGWYLSTDINYENRITNNTTVSTASNHTLVAKWSLIVYNINYNLGTNGVANEVSPTSATYDESFAVGAPTREGYTYSGWRVSSGLNTNLAKYGSSSDSVNQPITSAGNTLYISTGDKTIYFKNLTTSKSGVTLTAMWTANQYTVTLNANGGSISSNSNWTGSGATATKQVTYGNGYSTLPTSTTVTRAGYTFGGWYTDTNYTTQVTTSTKVTTASNHSIYAKWTANEDTNYTVKHWQQNIDGDASLHDTTNYTLVQTQNLSGTTATSVTPAVNNYEGFTAPSTQTVTIAADGTTAVNYYYTRNSYTLTVNLNNMLLVNDPSETYYYGEQVTIITVPRTGYTFTNITGDKDTNSFTMPASNVTVTVNGEANAYDITYNLDGGSVTGTNPTSGTYDSVLTLESPTKTGYTFTGWTVTSGLNTSTAKYGSSSSTVTSSIASASTLAIGSSATANTYVKNLTAASNGSVTLTANWQANTYTVTFNTNGGDTSNSVATVTYNSTYGTMPEPTKTGYVFMGWFTDASEGTKITSTTTVTITSNQTLYAHWRPIGYNVVYYNQGYMDTTNAPEVFLTSGNGQITVNWSAQSNAIEYRIFTYYDNGAHRVADTTNTSYTITGLTNGTEYGVFVLTHFQIGDQELWGQHDYYSKIKYATPSATTQIPTVTAKVTSNTNMRLKWNTVSGATKYKVLLKGPNDTNYVERTETTSTSYNATIQSSELGYNYKIIILPYVNGAYLSYTDSNATIKRLIPGDVAYDEIITLNIGNKTGYTYKGCHLYSINSTTAKYGLDKNEPTNSITNSEVLYTKILSFKNLTTTEGQTVILESIYNAKTYSVTLNTNGGDTANSVATVTYNSTYGNIITPTRTGYNFDGWYTDASEGTKITSETKVTTAANHTLYAHWEPIGYYLNVDLNGGTDMSSPIPRLTAGDGQVYVEWDAVPGATKYGVFYRPSPFTGNYTNIDTTSTNYTITGLTNNTQYEIVVKAYNINIDRWTTHMNVSSNRYRTSRNVTPSATAANPTLNLIPGNGQIYVDWNKVTGATKYRVYKYINGTYTQVAETTANNYTITGLTNGVKTGVVVYAYVNNSWIITKNTRYETPMDGNQTFDYYSWIASPYKEGYTFTGWKVTSGLPESDTPIAYYGLTTSAITTPITSSNQLLTDNSSSDPTNRYIFFKNLSATDGGQVTLTAQWEANTYNITYNLDGGILENANPSTGTYDSVLTLKSPTKPGYTFTGWTVTSGLGSTAKYGSSSSTVTSSIANNTTLAIGSSAIANTYVKNLTSEANGNVTLKANWSAKSITVTLDANGGTISSNVKWNGSGSTVTKDIIFDSAFGDLPTSSQITKTGYNLLGWYTEPTGGTPVTSETVLNYFQQEYTIYAHWTDTTNPTISLSKLTYKQLDMETNWSYNSGGTYNSSNGALSISPNSSGTINIWTEYVPVNGEFWYFTYDAYVTSSSQYYKNLGQEYGGLYVASYYYNSSKSAATITQYDGTNVSNNGYTSKLEIENSDNAWENNKDILWGGSVGKFKYHHRYGTNAKYVRLRFRYDDQSDTIKSYWSEFPVQIRNLKVYGEAIPNNFYLIKYGAEDNDGIQTVKWASGNRAVSYFTSNGTSLSDNNGEIRVTSNGTYTVYAKDTNGNEVVETIEITNIE